jgi:hypothetical protein
VSKRVVGRENRQSHRSRHRLVQLTGVAKRPYQAVMRLYVARIDGDGCAKSFDCPSGVSLAQQIEAGFAKGVG